MVDDTIRQLLELSDDVQELNYYNLLGIHPSEASPERLEQACRLRNAQLQKADPKLRPLVAKLAKMILNARQTLTSPTGRAEYNHKLDVRRQQQSKRARTQFRGAVQAALVDGKLPLDRVGQLIQRAADLGVPQAEAENIVATTPKHKPAHGDAEDEPELGPMIDLAALAEAEEAADLDALTPGLPVAAGAEVQTAQDELPNLEEEAVPSAAGAKLRRQAATPEALKAKIVIGIAAAGAVVSVLLALTPMSAPRRTPRARPDRQAPAEPGPSRDAARPSAF